MYRVFNFKSKIFQSTRILKRNFASLTPLEPESKLDYARLEKKYTNCKKKTQSTLHFGWKDSLWALGRPSKPNH